MPLAWARTPCGCRAHSCTTPSALATRRLAGLNRVRWPHVSAFRSATPSTGPCVMRARGCRASGDVSPLDKCVAGVLAAGRHQPAEHRLSHLSGPAGPDLSNDRGSGRCVPDSSTDRWLTASGFAPRATPSSRRLQQPWPDATASALSRLEIPPSAQPTSWPPDRTQSPTAQRRPAT